MAGGSANDAMVEAMSCPLCATMYLTTDEKTSKTRTPCMVFGCWHTFCRPCLVLWAQRSPRGQFSCPTCRTVCTVAVQALPTNFSLRDVVEAERASTGQTKLMCSECAGDDASHYCQGCNMLLCHDCLRSHQKSTLRVCKHPAATLQTIDDFKQSKQAIPKQKRTCTGHDNKELDIYCITCQTPICYIGSSTDHDGHKKSALSEVAKQHQVRNSLALFQSIRDMAWISTA